MVSCLIAPNESGHPSVCVVLSPDNTFITVEGAVRPGIALDPEAARAVARNLLRLADVIESVPRGAVQ
jgi:hypothetical protein